jgi:hypothetical protein
LKKNTTVVRNKMVAEVERRRLKREAEERRQQEEKHALLEAGVNPYELWRRRDISEAVVKEQARLSALKKLRGQALLAKLEHEEVRTKQEEAAALRERKMKDDYQLSQSGAKG